MTAAAGPQRPAPCCLVIFGASGDLTKRLLMPALYNLAVAKLLPDSFAVVGVSRSPLSDADFRKSIKDGLGKFASSQASPDVVDTLMKSLFYIAGDFDDAATYERLEKKLTQLGGERKTGGSYLFYLATPPSVFGTVAQHLGKSGLTKESKDGWRRLIIEKPFGTDLASAKELNQQLLAVFAESQIFRIDHYLGKETVQNIMALRFANGMFEALWNRDRIDHVQITVAETVSVETRGKFYDATGTLRDMVPNHLFQLLSLIAMEPPICFDADAVRAEKVKTLQALHRYTPEDALRNGVRGQYAAGAVDGKPVVAYRQAPDVARDSDTETYVALRLMIDNWRWAGVPFYLRTGKALNERRTEVAIKFKEAPFALFRDTPVDSLGQNFIILRIQPDEGIALQFNAKVPGPQIELEGVRMNFKYKDYFDIAPSTGYETLIYDCMMGDATLFQRADEVETAWSVVQPFLDAWRNAGAKGLEPYAAGSEGPEGAGALLARDGRKWRPIATRPQK